MTNGPAPLFAAAPRWLRRNCVYRALKNPIPKSEEGLPLKNGRPSMLLRPPGERQRKGKPVHSSSDKLPLNFIARGKSFRLRRSFSRGPPSPAGRYFFFSFGPCTARFLFFFWKKKRLRPQARVGGQPPPSGGSWAGDKWGVQCTSHRWYPFRPARKGK